MLTENRVREIAVDCRRALEAAPQKNRQQYFRGQWQVIVREHPEAAPLHSVFFEITAGGK